MSFTSDRIYHLQHSFRKGLSCTTQLLAVLHKVGKILDKGDEIDIVYLDLTRAFDTVCHAHLLQNLRPYGITGLLFNWLSDYLCHRRQRVVANGASSSWVEVCSGVPQGSVFRPILFILYVNDLPDSVSFSNIAMFADDTKCFKSIKTTCDASRFQQDLDSLSVWASINELTFQINQPNVRIFGLLANVAVHKGPILLMKLHLNQSPSHVILAYKCLMICYGRTILRLLCLKPIECSASCEDIVQRVSLVTSRKHSIYRW